LLSVKFGFHVIKKQIVNTQNDIKLLRLETPVQVIDLFAIFGPQTLELPWVLRILLENALRAASHDARSNIVRKFQRWLDDRTSDEEIEFRPVRVLMHDTTCVPALVDIAAMRDAVFEAGFNPDSLSPKLQVDVSVDHSVAVDIQGSASAKLANMSREIQRNEERYKLLKWAANVLQNVKVHPPGTGIMHTLNLEQLSTVVAIETTEQTTWAFPDAMIGTDSHTPMVNGLGVLAWGVGGLEAESVLFGLPLSLRIPDVVGVRLVGKLPEGVVSTDLALVVTERLRKLSVAGAFVEFFGDGVSELTAGDRAVVANMAPEYGASTGYFAIDEKTIAYLRATQRPDLVVSRVEAVAKALHLWFDSQQTPQYTKVLEINLAELSPAVAGPRRPQDRLALQEVSAAFAPCVKRCEHEQSETPLIPSGAIAIAAITSCTNTSDPKLLVAAGLLARNAIARGLKPPPWVKTSLAPGSPAAEIYLERAGILDALAGIGFDIVGFGCTTCIGNSGPLLPVTQTAITKGVKCVAVLSGNRNFPGRIHPAISDAFLCSPALVVAYALAGDIMRDMQNDPIGKDQAGNPVFLSDIWPSSNEIEEVARICVRSEDFATAFQRASINPEWLAIESPETSLFPWLISSTYLRKPPFVSMVEPCRLGIYEAHPLLVLDDDITTDHISPAGQILSESHAGRYLVAKGEQANDLNVYAARRGNWEVMLRGVFDNAAAINALTPHASPGSAMHAPSGYIGPIWDVARRYTSSGEHTIIVAGERYGTGSSRDWAAKGVSILGVRAIVAQSFERIHRTNLIGMGVLPLTFASSLAPKTLGIKPGVTFCVDAENIKPRCNIQAKLRYSNGEIRPLTLRAEVETEMEIKTLKAGGMIPLILSLHIEKMSQTAATRHANEQN
jgi:aconitate hydratase